MRRNLERLKLQVKLKQISLTLKKGYLFAIFPMARLEGSHFYCLLSGEPAQRVFGDYSGIFYIRLQWNPDRLPGTTDDP